MPRLDRKVLPLPLFQLQAKDWLSMHPYPDDETTYDKNHDAWRDPHDNGSNAEKDIC